MTTKFIVLPLAATLTVAWPALTCLARKYDGSSDL
jgi:hypothetical protein